MNNAPTPPSQEPSSSGYSSSRKQPDNNAKTKRKGGKEYEVFANWSQSLKVVIVILLHRVIHRLPRMLKSKIPLGLTKLGLFLGLLFKYSWKIVCNTCKTWFFNMLRTGSNPAEINQLRRHTGKNVFLVSKCNIRLLRWNYSKLVGKFK